MSSMICKKCGEKIAEKSIFCPNCGEKQGEKQKINSVLVEKPPPTKQEKITIIKGLLALAFLVIITVFLVTTFSGKPARHPTTAKGPNPVYDTMVIDQFAKVTASGNYINLGGNIKNASNDRSLKFISLRYEALDKNGKVIDSQTIPITDEIKPQERKIFSSMAKYNPQMTNFRIIVNAAQYK